MPATDSELCRVAHEILDGRVSINERRIILTLVAYELDRTREYSARGKAAQRRALTLLKSFLTPSQKRSFSRNYHFNVTDSAGGRYRMIPNAGLTFGLEKHKTKWYKAVSYCLHDARGVGDNPMPNADITLAHLLWIRADE